MKTTRTAALLLCFALALPLALRAAVPASLYVEDLTWTELRDAVRAGKTTIIVPIGGTEQNGPHMALGKHNVRARFLAEKIARALGNALVAPVIAYVPEGAIAPPTQHMKYPGTITIPAETFEKVLEYAAKSFRLHGFHDVVFLADHGGYLASDRAVAQRLNREWAGTPVRAHAIEEYYRVTEVEYPRALESRGIAAAEIGTHAGLADTSLALAVDPRLVRTDMLQPSAASLANADGVRGDPRRSSAELGQLGVDAIVAKTTAAIRQATAPRH
jgi:creatinine amidohydrolase/Fe(II)-dependent formamide hydrolase-like protein